MDSATTIRRSATTGFGRMIQVIAWAFHIRIAPWPPGIGMWEEFAGRLQLGEPKDSVEPKGLAELKELVERKPVAVRLPRGLRRRPTVARLAGSKTEALRGCRAITVFPASGG